MSETPQANEQPSFGQKVGNFFKNLGTKIEPLWNKFWAHCKNNPTEAWFALVVVACLILYPIEAARRFALLGVGFAGGLALFQDIKKTVVNLGWPKWALLGSIAFFLALAVPYYVLGVACGSAVNYVIHFQKEGSKAKI